LLPLREDKQKESCVKIIIKALRLLREKKNVGSKALLAATVLVNFWLRLFATAL
jgi:hypothetical protein